MKQEEGRRKKEGEERKEEVGSSKEEGRKEDRKIGRMEEGERKKERKEERLPCTWAWVCPDARIFLPKFTGTSAGRRGHGVGMYPTHETNC